jgi:beta-lactamase regulating signal transducer with metallopeptidase domain
MLSHLLDSAFAWHLTLLLMHISWLGVVVAATAAGICRCLPASASSTRYIIHLAAMVLLLALLPACAALIRDTPVPVQAVPAPALTTTEAPPIVIGDVAPPAAALSSSPSVNWTGLISNGVTLLYLAGCGTMLLRLVLAVRGGERLCRTGAAITRPDLLAIVARQSQRLGLRTVPLLRSCARIAVPALAGTLRPAILLPAALVAELSPEQLAAVIAHELAHLRRYDHLVILLQRFIEAVFFFHPAVWYLSLRIDAERENCCDDLASAAVGDRWSYAETLVRLAELTAPSAYLAASLAADGHVPSQLQHRVRRLLDLPSSPAVRLSRWGLVGSMVTAIGALGIACLLLVPAQAEPTVPTADKPAVENKPVPRDTKRVVQFVADDKPVEDKKTEPEKVPADWFQPDPYSELGLDTTFGDGWNYLRLASHPGCKTEIKINPEQQQSLSDLTKAHQALDSAKEKELRDRGGLGEEWIRWRTQNWNDARTLAEILLTGEQKKRVEQLLIQKQGYRGFMHPQVVESLDMGDEQRDKVRKAIVDHSGRLNKIDADLAAAEQKIDKPEAEKAAELFRLRKERNAAGVASHRQAWDDIYLALTAEQRTKYLELRGKPVKK